MLAGITRHPVWAALAIALLLLAGAGAYLWHRAGSSTPVSEADAVASFRAKEGAAGERVPGVPRPGVYTFRQTGSERGAAGPISIDRGLPPQARYVVTLSRRGYQQELDISKEHMEAVRFRVGRDGTRAVWRRTHVTFLGFGRDDRRALSPHPLHLAADLRPGRRWSGRYRAGELRISFRTEVLRRESVTVEGRRLPALVVRTTADTEGPHPGTRIDTLWWSPALSLPLRWWIDMEINGTVELDTRAELTLERTAPAT